MGKYKILEDAPEEEGIFRLKDYLIIPPKGPGPIAVVSGKENAERGS